MDHLANLDHKDLLEMLVTRDQWDHLEEEDQKDLLESLVKMVKLVKQETLEKEASPGHQGLEDSLVLRAHLDLKGIEDMAEY